MHPTTLTFSLPLFGTFSDFNLSKIIAELQFKVFAFAPDDYILIQKEGDNLEIVATKEITNLFCDDKLFVFCGDLIGDLENGSVKFEIPTFANGMGYLEISNLTRNQIKQICTEIQPFYERYKISDGDIFVKMVKQSRKQKVK